MFKGTYIGPLSHLKGQTALLRYDDDQLMAQFDDPGLDEGYGWHPFSRLDFEIDRENNDEATD